MTLSLAKHDASSGHTVSCLLRAIFGPEEAQKLFVVLRNGELLPDGMAGTDLDVSVLPGRTLEEVTAYLQQRAATVGWEAVCISARPHMVGVSLLDCTDECSASGVHFDIFNGITLLCIPLVRSELLLTESAVRKGVRELSTRARALATVVHHVAWSGGLGKEKYARELELVLADPHDRTWVLAEIRRAFGGKISAELEFGGSPCSLGSGKRRRRALFGVIRESARRSVPDTMRAVIRYYSGQVGSMLSPPGLVGARGGRIGSAPGRPLNVELACSLSPHGFAAKHVRGPVSQVQTLNGPRYAASLATMWRRWRFVRWLAPSAFLWVQAKRGRVVVLDRLPASLVMAHTLFGLSWVAVRDR